MKKIYKAPLCEAYDISAKDSVLITSPSGYEGDKLYLNSPTDEEEKVTYRVRFGDYAD